MKVARKTGTIAMVLLAGGWLASLAGCGYGFAGSGGQQAYGFAESAPDQAKGPKTYNVGGGYVAGPVHPTNIKTVYVEVFKSQDFRRELEFRLTEALVKRILQDTPYTIAPKNEADSIITGEIQGVSVTLLGSDFDSNLPKEEQPVLTCNWAWKNRRTGEMIGQRVGMQQASEFIPLANETFFDGTEEGIDDLAERIVEAMQSSW